MDIQTIQKATAEALGVSLEDVSYVTAELLEEYKSSATEAAVSDGDVNGDTGTLNQWGTYGNTVTFDPGPSGNVYWKQNPKGTSGYGCGTSQTLAIAKSVAKYVTYKGRCSDGKNWFFIGNYNG